MRGYKEILVIDLEATCWENADQRKSEIIEIGLVELDLKSLAITREESIIVKPTTTEISKYCTDLTTLTPEFVEENGITFKEACEVLRKKYKSNRVPWFSFGAYDRHQFVKQCGYEHVLNPMSDAHTNIKTMLGVFAGEKEVGMARALSYLDLTLKGTHHRGVDDAKNIAEILIKIISSFRKSFVK